MPAPDLDLTTKHSRGGDLLIATGNSADAGHSEEEDDDDDLVHAPRTEEERQQARQLGCADGFQLINATLARVAERFARGLNNLMSKHIVQLVWSTGSLVFLSLKKKERDVMRERLAKPLPDENLLHLLAPMFDYIADQLDNLGGAMPVEETEVKRSKPKPRPKLYAARRARAACAASPAYALRWPHAQVRRLL